MKEKFEDPFHFTRNEQKGILLLVAIMFACFLIQNRLFSFQQEKSADRLIEIVISNDLLDSLASPIDSIPIPLESDAGKRVSLKRVKKRNPRSYKKYIAPKRYEPDIIAINQATAQDFEKLVGIGSVFSQRIVKFRDKLGGFHDIEQIAQVYGLPDSTFKSIKKYLTIRNPHTKISFNTVTTDSLANHPYISWKQAKILTNYRNQRDDLDSIEQLYAIKAFDSAYIKKILPYLSCRNSN